MYRTLYYHRESTLCGQRSDNMTEQYIEAKVQEIDNLIQYDYRRYGINVLLFYKYKECEDVVYQK